MSRINDIKIELLEYSDAKIDEEEGKLAWELVVQPGQKITKSFTYQVKYPKSKKLLID